MTIAVPHLSTKGWVKNPTEQADLILGHFFTTVDKQSQLYGENISSLTKLVKEFGHDPLNFTDVLKNTLERLFERYFENVRVTAEFKYNNPENQTGGPYTVTLTILSAINGQTINLARGLELINGTFKTVALANEGIES